MKSTYTAIFTLTLSYLVTRTKFASASEGPGKDGPKRSPTLQEKPTKYSREHSGDQPVALEQTTSTHAEEVPVGALSRRAYYDSPVEELPLSDTEDVEPVPSSGGKGAPIRSESEEDTVDFVPAPSSSEKALSKSESEEDVVTYVPTSSKKIRVPSEEESGGGSHWSSTSGFGEMGRGKGSRGMTPLMPSRYGQPPPIFRRHNVSFEVPISPPPKDLPTLKPIRKDPFALKSKRHVRFAEPSSPPRGSFPTFKPIREDSFALKSKRRTISPEEQSDILEQSSESEYHTFPKREPSETTWLTRQVGEYTDTAPFEDILGVKTDPYNLKHGLGSEMEVFGHGGMRPQYTTSEQVVPKFVVEKHVYPDWVHGKEFSHEFSGDHPSLIGQLEKRSKVFKPPVEKPHLHIVGGARTAMPVCPPAAFATEQLLFGGHFSVTYKARHIKTGVPVLRKDIVISIKQFAEFDMQYKMSRMTGFVPTIHCIHTDPSYHTYYHFDKLEKAPSGQAVEWPTAWKKNIPETREIDQVRVSPSGVVTRERIKPHKNIRPVSVYMDYVGGGDLFNFLLTLSPQNLVPLDRMLITQYLAEMYAIIHRIHELGVLHLDLKPENFVIGDDGHLLVIDFGLSLKITKGGVYIRQRGTPQYMAPEVRHGGYADETADYYSLGVIMYVMHELKSDFNDIQKVKFSHLTPPRMQEAIRGLTDKDPEVRRVYWNSLPRNFPPFEDIDWDEMAKRAYAKS